MNVDRGVANRLSEHLDATVAKEAGPSHDLDPSLAVTVERFFASDDAPPPLPGIADQIWADLMRDTVPVIVVPTHRVGQPDSGAHGPDDAMPGPAPRRVPSPLRRTAAMLMTAALVLLTLLGSFVAIRGSLQPIARDEQPARIPALDVVLNTVTIAEAPVAAWPADSLVLWSSMQRITLDPDAVEDVDLVDATGVGVALFTVETGQVEVDADGSVAVTRGPASLRAEAETLPAGMPITLNVGDQFFAPADVTFRRRNVTTHPASILALQLTSVEPMPDSEGVRYLRLTPDKVINQIPPAPARVALRRLLLLPGSRVAIDDLPGLQMLVVEEGALDLIGIRGPGELVASSWKTVTAGNGIAHFDTTTDLANSSAAPVSFLIVTIEPTD